MEDVNKIGFIVIQLEQWKNSGPWAIASWLQLGERAVSVFSGTPTDEWLPWIPPYPRPLPTVHFFVNPELIFKEVLDLLLTCKIS